MIRGLISGTHGLSLLLLASLFVMGGCNSGGGKQDDNKAPSGAAQANASAAGATGVGGLGAAAPPAIMQILSASKEGRSYKCTVCHSEYLDPKVMSRPAVRNKIIDSILDGTMPLEGDRVSPQDLATLRAWAGH